MHCLIHLPKTCLHLHVFLNVVYSCFLDYSPAARTVFGRAIVAVASRDAPLHVWASRSSSADDRWHFVVDVKGQLWLIAPVARRECWRMTVESVCSAFGQSSVQLWSTEVAGALQSSVGSVGSDGSILDQWFPTVFTWRAAFVCIKPADQLLPSHQNTNHPHTFAPELFTSNR